MIISGKKKAPALVPCCLSPALAPTQTALGRPLGLADLPLTCCRGEPGPQAGGRPPHGGRRRAFSPGVLVLSGSICSRPPKETLSPNRAEFKTGSETVHHLRSRCSP